MEKMIFVNQKMYFNTTHEVYKFQEAMSDYKNEFVVLPSSLYLKSYIDKGFIVGSQNISSEEGGSYTGEISARSLKDLDVEYALIGHYEVRRQYKDEYVNIQRRINQAIKNGLKVILCVGEDIDEKNKGLTKEVILKELNDLDLTDDVIICYEPIWSIGTDITPTNEEIEDIVNFIKEVKNLKVIYGGSVSQNNISILNKISNVDGFMVGGYALTSSNLKEVIEVVK